jgi:hypothetical protein
MSEQQSPQIQLVRSSLLNAVFAKFNELRNTVATLPIDPSTHGILKGLSYLDDGILWLKEAILNAPIELKKTEEVVAETPVLDVIKEDISVEAEIIPA